ncbi:MAG: hypothetical protein HKN56_00830 [Gammaproteobacteria bacterium]|nr:hypothetical protein [Gammaproteobacteria bacterium]
MKAFYCDCGQRLFFDSSSCLSCGAAVGFDPHQLNIVPVQPDYWSCENQRIHKVCNWLVPKDSGQQFCLSCGLNEVIPKLDNPGNLTLWARLEGAKRRLLYNLLSLNLTVTASAGQNGLRFRFLEDQRRNPDALEDFVATGHLAGTITINVAEADNVYRAAESDAFSERYRTLLGHFRHESGHYFFKVLINNPELSKQWRWVFGDERTDYARAMDAYYEAGASPDWPESYVSPYASSHPHEDWGETFAHYLHIHDTLETAHANGVQKPQGDDWIAEWMSLSVTLNELNRSLGLDDPYPFVLTERVTQKLKFIDRLIRQ